MSITHQSLDYHAEKPRTWTKVKERFVEMVHKRSSKTPTTGP